MSNHSGSYILNNTLCTLEEMGIFETIGKQKTRELAFELIKIGRRYDCNNNEILDGIGEDIGICYMCLKEIEDLEYGLCQRCR